MSALVAAWHAGDWPMAPGASTTAGCRCSGRTSRAPRTPSRRRPRCSRWASSSATTPARRCCRSTSAPGAAHGRCCARSASWTRPRAGRRRRPPRRGRRMTAPAVGRRPGRPPSSTSSTPGRAGRRAGPVRAGRLAHRPEVKAAILDCFRDRATETWDLGGVLRFRDRVGLPPKSLLDGREAGAALARAGRGGSSPAGRPCGQGSTWAGRRRDAAVVRERRGVDRGGHDGRQPRPRRLVRAGRRARPPLGGRDPRRRPRARRRPAGDRGGRRVRRGRLSLLEGVLVGAAP